MSLVKKKSLFKLGNVKNQMVDPFHLLEKAGSQLMQPNHKNDKQEKQQENDDTTLA